MKYRRMISDNYSYLPATIKSSGLKMGLVLSPMLSWPSSLSGS